MLLDAQPHRVTITERLSSAVTPFRLFLLSFLAEAVATVVMALLFPIAGHGFLDLLGLKVAELLVWLLCLCWFANGILLLVTGILCLVEIAKRLRTHE